MVIGNLTWMEEHAVHVGAKVRGEVARLEDGGCTVVVVAVSGCAHTYHTYTHFCYAIYNSHMVWVKPKL